MDEFHSRIEDIFRNSTSSDELFDAFRDAIDKSISNFDLYKILLGNPALSGDEIKMFAEKIAKEMPQQKFSAFMWTANIFENQKDDCEKLEDAFKYYQKAFEREPENVIPLLRLIKLYNHDLETTINKKIIDFIDLNIKSVTQKSAAYFSLAELYKRKGNLQLASKYLALGEKAEEVERLA